MTDSLFNDGTPATPTEPENYTDALVGEGKQYADTEQLSKAAWHKQRHIETLEAELREARTQATAVGRLEDLYQKLSTVREPPADAPVPPVQGERGDSPKGLSPEELRATIREEFAAEENTRRKNRNLTEVQDTLIKTLGSDFQPKLRSKARELGVGEQFLNNLAAEQPKAFFALVGLSDKGNGQNLFTPPASSMNPTSRETNGTVKNESYYKRLKQTNPEMFKAGTKIDLEMHNEAMKLGEKFFE